MLKAVVSRSIYPTMPLQIRSCVWSGFLDDRILLGFNGQNMKSLHIHCITSWWSTYPSEKYESQLVRIIPYIMENNTYF